MLLVYFYFFFLNTYLILFAYELYLVLHLIFWFFYQLNAYLFQAEFHQALWVQYLLFVFQGESIHGLILLIGVLIELAQPEAYLYVMKLL